MDKDLSADTDTRNTKDVSHIISMERRARMHRDIVFYSVLAISLLFLSSVLIVALDAAGSVISAILEGSDDTDTELFIYLLLMIAVLGGIGTTLCLGMMRYAFGQHGQQRGIPRTLDPAPTASALAELFQEIARLLKRKVD